MKKLLILPLLIALCDTASASDLEALSEEKCGTCHIVSNITPEKLKNIMAPPMWGAMKKVKEAYPDKDKAIAFMVDFMKNPTKEKMLFPEETFKLFGVMPSQKGIVSDEELNKISEYLYNKFK